MVKLGGPARPAISRRPPSEINGVLLKQHQSMYLYSHEGEGLCSASPMHGKHPRSRAMDTAIADRSSHAHDLSTMLPQTTTETNTASAVLCHGPPVGALKHGCVPHAEATRQRSCSGDPRASLGCAFFNPLGALLAPLQLSDGRMVIEVGPLAPNRSGKASSPSPAYHPVAPLSTRNTSRRRHCTHINRVDQ